MFFGRQREECVPALATDGDWPIDAGRLLVARAFSMISLVPVASYGTHPLSA